MKGENEAGLLERDSIHREHCKSFVHFMVYGET